MQKFLNHPLQSYLAVPLRIYLGLVFIVACWYKIEVPSAFALSVATYQMLPLWLVNLMAICLPWVELIVGIFLCIGLKARASALSCAVMLCMFMVAISYALYFDLRLSCGCFASADAAEEMSADTLWRDALWLLISVYLVLIPSGKIGIDGLIQRKSLKEFKK